MDCEKGPLMHNHHIIPRYMGGRNMKENLVEVTIIQHAMYHFCNYQLWGNDEDRLAWKGLSGIIPKEQVVYESILLGQSKGVDAARTPEAIERKKKKLKEIKHQQGEKNSQYGKKWIYNLKLHKTKRIDKNLDIPEGWELGRIENFDSYFEKQKSKKFKELKRQEDLKNKILYYEKMYDYYLNKGFPYIRDFLGYDRTQESLIQQFKKYVRSYIPYEKAKKQWA